MMRRWNRAAGILVTVVLLWVLYRQLHGHLHSTDGQPWYAVRYPLFLYIAFAMLPLNIGVEAAKWQFLLRSTGAISFGAALRSVLGGIAFSVITPNRLGDYPGRILMLDRKAGPRTVSIAILGAISQFLTVMLAGLSGLAYAMRHMTAWWIVPLFVLVACVTLITAVFYFSFERWAPAIARLPLLRKWMRVGAVLQQYTFRELLLVLAIAILRFGIFTLQYYFVLRAVGLVYPVGGALLLCALFFFILALVPSIVLAEAGIRGEVGLYLFGAFVPHKLSLVVATLAIWLGNMMIPALLGGLLFLQKRWRS